MSDDRRRLIEQMKCPCCGEDKTDPHLLALLLDLEEAQGRPLKINSGYRCVKHNEALIKKGLPAAKNSQHVLGLAADVATESVEDQKRLIANAQKIGFTGIGIGKTFVHLDIGPARTWRY